MAQIVNPRDLTLEASSTRIEVAPLPGNVLVNMGQVNGMPGYFTAAKVLELGASQQVFEIPTAGDPNPSSLKLQAIPKNLSGNVKWEIVNGQATLAINANTAVLDLANMVTDAITVRVSITDGTTSGGSTGGTGGGTGGAGGGTGGGTGTAGTDAAVVPNGVPDFPGGLTLDEKFSGSQVDTSIWNNAIYYQNADTTTVNYKTEGSVLYIWPDTGFVDRTIDSDSKFQQKFGYFEIRAKLPIGLGVMPAFWLIAHPSDGSKPGIDVMKTWCGATTGADGASALTIHYYGDNTIKGGDGAAFDDGATLVGTPAPATFASNIDARYTVANYGALNLTMQSQWDGSQPELPESWDTRMTGTSAGAEIIILCDCINDTYAGYGNGTEDYKTYLRDIVNSTRNNGKYLILQTPNETSDGQVDDYRNAMLSVASEMNVPVIDVYTSTYNYRINNSLAITDVCPDGFEPNQANYTRIGQYCATRFNEIISGDSSAPHLSTGGGTPYANASYHPTDYRCAVFGNSGGAVATHRLTDAGPSAFDLAASYHTYGMQWDPNGDVTFLFDGVQIGAKVTGTGLTTSAMYPLLSVWFGEISGTPTTASTPTGQSNSFQVDYIKAWQFTSEGGPPAPSPAPDPSPSPTPASEFHVGNHFHRLYNNASSPSPEPTFSYGAARDWNIEGLHDFYVWNSDGSINTTLIKQVYAGHKNHGAKIVKCFGTVPQHAAKRPNESNPFYPGMPGALSGPADLDKYETYCFDFITAMKDYIWAVEGWNEPFPDDPTSGSTDWPQYTTMTLTELCDTQKRLYRAAKHVDPNMLVFSPAQAYIGGIPKLLAGKTSQGEPLTNFFDVFAWHPYDLSANNAIGAGDYVTNINQIKQYLADAGASSKLLADTEHGFLQGHTTAFSSGTNTFDGNVLYDTTKAAHDAGLIALCWYAYDDTETLGNPNPPATNSALSTRLGNAYTDFDTKYAAPAPAPTPDPSPSTSPGGGVTLNGTVDWYGDSIVVGWDPVYTGTTSEGQAVAHPMPDVFNTTDPVTTGVNRGVNGALAEDALFGTNGVPWGDWQTHIASTSSNYVILCLFSHDSSANLTQRVSTLISQAKTAGKTVFVGTIPPSLQAGSLTHQQIAQAQIDAASSAGAYLIDIHAYMTDYMANHNLALTDVCPDKQHPSQTYYSLMGKWAKSEMLRVLNAGTTAQNPSPTPTPDPTPTPTPTGTWPYGRASAGFDTLTFSDDFNTGSAPDTAKWKPNFYYDPNNSTVNYDVNSGNLRIWPALDGSGNFFRRVLTTEGHFAQQYGYFEVEATMPIGEGLHPILGIIANDLKDIGFGHTYTSQPSWSNSSNHPITYTTDVYDIPSDTFSRDEMLSLNIDLSTASHVYALEWTPGNLRWFFDGVQVGSTDTVSITGQFYPYIGLAMSGDAPLPNSSGTPTGTGNAMLMNYARVWTLHNNANSSSGSTPSPSPDPSPSPTPLAYVAPIGQSKTDYPTMTFRSEFTNGSIDTTKWPLRRLWYEDSSVATRVANIDQNGGNLRMWPQAPYPDDGGGTNHNATLCTDGAFWQKYGYFEARMKLPIGKGCWPAFWLYSHTDANGNEWGKRPEIDIIEAYSGGDSWWADNNTYPIDYGATVWSDQTNGVSHRLGDAQARQRLNTAFHTYACRWDANGVTFYFDGQSIGGVNDTSLNVPMYILLDLWMGSASGAPDNSDPPQGPNNSLLIDYVRCWSLSDGSTTTRGLSNANATTNT